MLIDTLRDYHAYATWANSRILKAAEKLTADQFLNPVSTRVAPGRWGTASVVLASGIWSR